MTIPLPVTVQQDAKNRALRTFVQGLEVDLAIAVAALTLSSVNQINSKTGLLTFGLALAKTVATTAASYVMRRFMDGSAVPTPAPAPVVQATPAPAPAQVAAVEQPVSVTVGEAPPAAP